MVRLKIRFFIGLTFTLALTPWSGTAQDVQPYEGKLNRLAEILGSLHLIETICLHKHSPDWQLHMNDLLDAEEPSHEHRQALVDYFNEGYESYRLAYHRCTPSAKLARKIYFEEAIEMIDTLINYYGF